MQQPFDSGKKVFFLYPPQDFSKSIIKRLYEEGFEIYKLNSSSKILPLIKEFPNSILFINSDYPYTDFSISDFNDNILSNSYEDLFVYCFFNEKVSFGDKIKDYVSIERDTEEVYSDIHKILFESEAHGKREFVRFGNYNEILSTISFICNKNEYSANMHDISPKALSFSADKDMSELIGAGFTKMKLKVGAYEIQTTGHIDSSRMIGDKKIYIAVFDDNPKMKSESFNFIFTSLEKGMDEILNSL